MKTPNKGFVTLLQNMDSALSVRWGSAVGAWVIERRGVIGETEIYYLTRREERLRKMTAIPENTPKFKRALETFKGVAEELISAKRGYRVIVFADNLDMKTFNAICAADMQRYGGYSRYADELERKEDAESEERERVRGNKQHALHKEVYDMLNFVWRKKEDALLNGERDLAKLLHGEKLKEGQKLVTVEQF